MKRPPKTGWLFWPALLVIFLAAQSWKDRGLIQGRPPPLGTRALDGARFDWDDVAGRPAVLYFWATWCPICGATRGNVEALAADYPVISVALQSGTDPVLRDYVRREGFTLPVFPDPEGTIAARFGLRGVPAIFIVDAGGTVRYAMTGYTSELGLRVRLWLAAHRT
jgi:thiol-disulfide isomerase/thioredoxin